MQMHAIQDQGPQGGHKKIMNPSNYLFLYKFSFIECLDMLYAIILIS